jgi:dienelactone hydrolase
MNIKDTRMVRLGKKLLILTICTFIFISASSLSSYAAGKKNIPKTIQFESKDGFIITGTIKLPAGASISQKVPLIILLHSLGTNRKVWEDFSNELKSYGTATLAIDLRGHGQSILDKNEKAKFWPSFQEKDYLKYPDDITSAIKFVKDNYPEININEIALIGSDISANAAIIAASRNNKNIVYMALFSPTIQYKGLVTRIPLVEWGVNPILIIVSKGDKYTYESCADLIRYAQGPKELKVFPEGGNGLMLMKTQPESERIIIEQLKKYFF